MTTEPTDGIEIGPGLWAAWVINSNNLDAQAWVLDLAAMDAISGCACPRCAPHEQTS